MPIIDDFLRDTPSRMISMDDSDIAFGYIAVGDLYIWGLYVLQERRYHVHQHRILNFGTGVHAIELLCE